MRTIAEAGGHSYAALVVRKLGEFRAPFGGAEFACLLWDHSGGRTVAERSVLAQALLESGCRFAACGGRDCEAWHDAVDEEIFCQNEDGAEGESETGVVMTTWHEGESPDEVAIFFVSAARFGVHGQNRHLVLHVGSGPETEPIDAAVRRAALGPFPPPDLMAPNRLDLEITGENGLSFVLRVDGRSIGDLVGASEDSAIPYWIVEDGLPTLPPRGGPVRDPEIRIVAACSCGEYGCAHTRCRVRSVGDRVVFEEFSGDVSEEGKRSRFEFDAANFDSVVREMVARARAEER